MSHPLLRLVPLFRGSRAPLSAGVLGLLLATGLNLLGPWLVARVIDVHLAAGDRDGVIRTGLLIGGLLVLNLVLTWGARMGLEVSAQRAMLELKRRLFDHLVDHDLAFHDTRSSGQLITRVQGDTESMRVLFTEVIFALPADIVLFVGMFAVTALSAPDLLPLLFAVVPPYLVLMAVFRKLAPPRFIAQRAVKSRLTGFLTEHLRAMPTLRQLGRQGWADRRAEALDDEVYRVQLSAQLVPVGYFNAVSLVRQLGMVALLWIGAGRVSAGELTVGALVMGLGYLRQMFDPLMRLSHHLTTLERARAAALRIGEILDTPRRIVDPVRPLPWPGLRGALRLEDVHFHYSAGTPVLRGLSLEVPAGSHVGIVGATGAGKSTVLNLLLRFRDPVAGRVSVDGVDLRDLAVASLRRHVGLVLQDVHLFPGTVLQNLGGDPERAQRALDTLGIKLPLDRLLRERGGNLSRGERQLLTFARALVEDPELLVLDEATSAVDPATEARVQGALARLLEGRTTVTVAHRLATVRGCDRIYVLGAGQVQESGTHAELLALGGLYAGLHRLQVAA